MGSIAKVIIQLQDKEGKKENFEVDANDLVKAHYNCKNFGELLKKIRKTKEMTQEDLAKKTGVSITTISEIENGRRNTTEEMIMRLAKAMNVELVFTFKELEG